MRREGGGQDPLICHPLSLCCPLFLQSPSCVLAQLSQGPLPSQASLLSQALKTRLTPVREPQPGPACPGLLLPMAAAKEVALSPPPAETLGPPSESGHSQGQDLGRRSVLLEKTNHLASQDLTSTELAPQGAEGKTRVGQQVSPKARGEQRQSAFLELPPLHPSRVQQRRQEDALHLTWTMSRAPGGGTVRSAWLAQGGEQRSAFRKPSKHPTDSARPLIALPAADQLLGPTHVPCWPRVTAPSQPGREGDLWTLQTWPPRAALCSALRGTPALWLELNEALGPSAASGALLPPTLTSLGLSTQNRCAKCSVCFRLTADLVVHMRSQHKRAPAAGLDQPAKRRREEALTCPFCHEYFRERHHLSRHMMSHS